MLRCVTAALLVMDVQVDIVARYDNDGLLERLEHAIATARRASIPVIYVRVAFRAGHPEVSPHNRTFERIVAGGGFLSSAPGTQIHPRVAPTEGDIVVTKLRVSAFAGSDLAEILRAQRIDQLVLTGIATSGVVLSTLRQAADLDFRLIVLEDACADSDADVHQVLTEKVFPRQADVLTVDAWAARL
jgi:nicotinamidase-related amidase